MPEFKFRYPLRITALSCLFAVSLVSFGQVSHSFDAALAKTAPAPSTLEREVRADMSFLADDDLPGRRQRHFHSENDPADTAARTAAAAAFEVQGPDAKRDLECYRDSSRNERS
jgi:hypothetical protein